MNGNSWIILSIPSLSLDPVTFDGDPQTVTFLAAGVGAVVFDRRGLGYVTLVDRRYSLTCAEKEYVVSNTDGARWTFARLEGESSPIARIKRWESADGRVTVASYDASRLVALDQFRPGYPATATLQYSYAPGNAVAAGRLIEVSKYSSDGRRSSRAWRAAFAYYSGACAGGSTNDLRTAEFILQDPEGDGQPTTRTCHYRYYKHRTDAGFKHALKFEVAPEAFARMQAAEIDPLSAPGEVLEAFGARYFEYDARKRLTLERTAGRRTVFTHALSDGAPDRNWARRTVVQTEDSTTTYVNELNLPVLRIAGSEEKAEVIEWTYDRNGYLLGRTNHPAGARVRHPQFPSEDWKISNSEAVKVLNSTQRKARQRQPRMPALAK